MAEIQKSIVVNAPLREVYNQWTQFEDFPRFMEGVLEVRQLDDKRLHWRARVGGVEKEWHAEIVDQVPDRRLAWRSLRGAENAGAVLFDAVPNGTRVTLKLRYDPEGAGESVGDALGFVSRRVEGDLERFKKFIEQRQHATGAWRGEIHGSEVNPGR
ncbi:MAG TPA: SRPBCC family protein [Vicinamibacteria bacterium]|nr:SRPBCC family protein [Vicinamibacteria bacterium]